MPHVHAGRGSSETVLGSGVPSGGDQCGGGRCLSRSTGVGRYQDSLVSSLALCRQSVSMLMSNVVSHGIVFCLTIITVKSLLPTVKKC